MNLKSWDPTKPPTLGDSQVVSNLTSAFFGGRDPMRHPFVVFPNAVISTSPQSVNVILREVKSERH
jgi:hypothetical protein